jgi:hypothetical protein
MGPTMAKANFDLLYDVQILLGLITILLLLYPIHNLIKLNQFKDVFIYDFITTTKMC